ncbi:pilus assembly protein [Cupriavidus sp. USMAA2-4]|uniref:Type II secretion system protein H n=1 Tax=Cupriavidus malaysiensis TaxID=367825 RepID=A0A1D9I596_9BURK|nr:MULTISPECIES: GspH/FimT family pseudopilin [Cupriavidus]AOY93169.1 pilus assembly protein [Cupriavidus sp. USMAA2-4]AOZ07287.1 pilus assembly protein [Cupriavidus malaysiensis]
MRPCLCSGPPRAARGATLVELLCCLALLAILAATAYPAWQAWLARQRVVYAADRLAGSLALARSTAAARRQEVLLEALPGATGFDRGWRLRLADADADGTLAVVPLQQACLRVRLRGAGEGAALRVSAVGYSRSEHGGFFAATFALRCQDEQRHLKVGAQGRIRICTPGRDIDCGNADPP